MRLLRSIAAWHRHLVFVWLSREKGHLLFFSALPLPFLLLGCLILAAHADYDRIQAQRQRRMAIVCLAENVYFEARGEPPKGQYAVAEVTMNRVASPLFPGTVCEVVHEQRWDALRHRFVAAFSWTELEAVPRPRGAAWESALAVAESVYAGRRVPVVDGALFYHAKNARPSWAKSKKRVATIGRHVFYR